MSDTTPVGSVAMVTIDCADATELATFYSRLLGMTIAYQDDNVAMITGESGPAFGFGVVDHYTPPPWPDEKSQKQFHLDLKVDDIAGAEAACQRAGATRPDFQPGGDRWRVHARPGRPPVLPDALAGLSPTASASSGAAEPRPGHVGRRHHLGPEPAHRVRGEQRARPGHRQPADRPVRPDHRRGHRGAAGLERRADQVAPLPAGVQLVVQRGQVGQRRRPPPGRAAAPGRRPPSAGSQASAALPQPPRQAGARRPTRLFIGGRSGPDSRCR